MVSDYFNSHPVEEEDGSGAEDDAAGVARDDDTDGG